MEPNGVWEQALHLFGIAESLPIIRDNGIDAGGTAVRGLVKRLVLPYDESFPPADPAFAARKCSVSGTLSWYSNPPVARLCGWLGRNIISSSYWVVSDELMQFRLRNVRRTGCT